MDEPVTPLDEGDLHDIIKRARQARTRIAATFGIDDAAAMASGLPSYRPGSGIKDAGAGLTAGYWFSERFGILARAGASYLVGDAADSPVTDEGRRWQPAGGLALSYRF